MLPAPRPAENDGVERKGSELRLAEVIGALSYALDVTDGQPPGHALRSCVIGMRLVDALGLDESDQAAAFYGLLMKDAGCSSNAAAVSALYGTDDLAAKQAIRHVNFSKASEATAYVLRNVGGPRNLLRVVRAGKGAAKDLTQIRCERGARIARMLELPEASATAIASIGEHWDGKGHPLGLSREEIPLLARIFRLAQTVEVFHRDFGLDAACEMAVARTGTWFDPDLVRILLSLRSDQAFWASLDDDRLELSLGALEPEGKELVADDDRLDRVASAFALVIDAKSPYTYSHSTRVAEIAGALGTSLGFEPEELRDLRRAALLHDIGKLAVPNSILDKPASLTPAERAQVELHPKLSEQVLSRVAHFSDIAGIAGAHHEKLDGSGYWRGAVAAELPPAARILAVSDIYDALTTDRPYRAAMTAERASSIIAKEAQEGKLCPRTVEALEGLLPAVTIAA
jgi:putative nucleotidyltransferase with HDIG domain